MRATVPPIFSFDVTDTVMRRLGDDPYLHRKLTFLEQTSGLRARLRKETLKRDLARSVSEIEARLASIWTGAKSIEQKKRILFEIWDGVVERGQPNRVRAGQLIRRAVLRFIADRLPKDSPEGFSSEELAELNAGRTSEQVFKPYEEGF